MSVDYSVENSFLQITGASCDRHGNVWIGTNKGLLTMLSDGTVVEVKSHLLKNISSLVYDLSSDILWLTGDHQLYSYNPTTNQTHILDESDGISRNEYMPNSVLITDNKVYFGTTNGLLSVDKDISLGRKQNYELKLFDAPDTRFRLNYNHHPLTLHLAAVGQSVFDKVVYRYRLKDDDAPTVINGNTITLNSLQPGTYDLQVSYLTKEGDWSREFHLADIHVNAPWCAGGYSLPLSYCCCCC